jgi:hypothetical protein
MTTECAPTRKLIKYTQMQNIGLLPISPRTSSRKRPRNGIASHKQLRSLYPTVKVGGAYQGDRGSRNPKNKTNLGLHVTAPGGK